MIGDESPAAMIGGNRDVRGVGGNSSPVRAGRLVAGPYIYNYIIKLFGNILVYCADMQCE